MADTPTAAAAKPEARLTYGDKSVALPVLVGTENEVGVDIEKLRAQTGMITVDPGFGNTGACKSAITFIDGEKGILRYRGYAIEELAEKANFLEVAWLLINGELPNKEQLEGFKTHVQRHTMLHEDLRRFFDAMPKDAHPMPVCASAVSTLATFYSRFGDVGGAEDAAVRLIAKMPTIAAWAYKHHLGQPFIYPQNSLDYVSNFLRMMFATPCEEYAVDPVAAKALDLLLILHADHEQNCSTSTVRMVGSSKANLFASISAGISALWGPLHGGANQEVIEMLDEIAAGGESVDAYVAKAKDKKGTARLMGFGHRVYKNYDPRAAILKKSCVEVVKKFGGSSKLLDIAMRLEEIALKDEYFVSRKLYPNVDFYSGVIYKALGIPVNMFTVMFTLGRLPGWIAHWIEMRRDPDFRISRPRQVYTGANLRAYKPLAAR
jgi:citrate synthase